MFTSQELIDFLEKNKIKYSYDFKHVERLNGFSPLKNSVPNTVTWIKGEANLADLNSSLFIIDIKNRDSYLVQKNSDKMLISVENPRLVFAMLMSHIYKKQFKPGVSSSASIAQSAQLDENIYIGNNVTIGENVIIKNGTYIHPNVVIHDNVRIGEQCEIHSGAVIGSEGFGYEQDIKGNYFNIPHIGSVEIQNNVSIGSNSCIDRGVLDNTIIRENTKIDNLCHIAHNCDIGKNNMITASTMIAGSVVTGENVWFAPCSVVKNGLKIGANSIIGMGAVAIKNIDENDVVAGLPAKSLKKS